MSDASSHATLPESVAIAAPICLVGFVVQEMDVRRRAVKRDPWTAPGTAEIGVTEAVTKPAVTAGDRAAAIAARVSLLSAVAAPLEAVRATAPTPLRPAPRATARPAAGGEQATAIKALNTVIKAGA